MRVVLWGWDAESGENVCLGEDSWMFIHPYRVVTEATPVHSYRGGAWQLTPNPSSREGNNRWVFGLWRDKYIS